MVFIYSLLGIAPYHQEATQVLRTTPTIWVPDSIRAELGNVVWQWVLHRNVSKEQAELVLNDADLLFEEVTSTDSLWLTALELAVSQEHPVYDTIFVALALEKSSKVVTYDKKLLKRFPRETIHPTDYLNHQRRTENS